MTNLKCTVHSCMHHDANMCCKPNIKVDGPAAKTPAETNRVSYAPKGIQNRSACTTPNEKLEIACSAVECMYNQNSKCHASNVSINTTGGTAGCSTFTKR